MFRPLEVVLTQAKPKPKLEWILSSDTVIVLDPECEVQSWGGEPYCS